GRYAPGLARILRKRGMSFLALAHRKLNPAALAECAKHGVDVMAWTVNRPRDLARLAAMPEPFLLCTNHPDRWLAAVRGLAAAGARPLAKQSAPWRLCCDQSRFVSSAPRGFFLFFFLLRSEKWRRRQTGILRRALIRNGHGNFAAGKIFVK